MNQPEFFPIAAAPEHREPTERTKTKRVETLICGDCFVTKTGPDAAAEMKAHKTESDRCK